MSNYLYFLVSLHPCSLNLCRRRNLFLSLDQLPTRTLPTTRRKPEREERARAKKLLYCYYFAIAPMIRRSNLNLSSLTREEEERGDAKKSRDLAQPDQTLQLTRFLSRREKKDSYRHSNAKHIVVKEKRNTCV